MTKDDIVSGRKYKITNMGNSLCGEILTVSHIENGVVVRFIDPPFENFGMGIEYFLNSFEII